MISKKMPKRLLSFTMVTVFSATSLLGGSSLALSDEQKKIFDSGIGYFNIEANGASCVTSSATLNGSENVQKAFNYFVQRGLTPQQSAGIVGNLVAESGVDPGIVERNPPPNAPRGGFGIAQWTNGRRDAIERFAEQNGANVSDLAFQLDYLYDQELSKGYSNVLAEVKASTTILEASNVILLKFEIPRDRGPSVQQYRASLGQKVFELYAKDAEGLAPAVASTLGCGSGGIVEGFAGFPLKTSKERMKQLNRGCLDGAATMCRGGHPYVAYDIISDAAVPVISILDGKVVSIGQDKCPGRLISVYNAANDVTVSYLHNSMSQTTVTEGQEVKAGQVIGLVGTAAEGCGIPHLHIDAAKGDRRPGCRRENCPAENAALFEQGDSAIQLGKQLAETYNKLP